MNNLYQKNSISHSLYSIYVENLYDDDLFYHSENEDLTIIRDSNLLKPFIPFSKDSDRDLILPSILLMMIMVL